MKSLVIYISHFSFWRSSTTSKVQGMSLLRRVTHPLSKMKNEKWQLIHDQ